MYVNTYGLTNVRATPSTHHKQSSHLAVTTAFHLKYTCTTGTINIISLAVEDTEI